MGHGANNRGLGSQPHSHQPCCDLGQGASTLYSQRPLGSLPVPTFPDSNLPGVQISRTVTRIHFLLPTNLLCVCSSPPSQLSLLLHQVCVAISISMAKATPAACWVCKNHPSGRASQGNARPEDGALGLFTLRHIITERWIRSYLRSAFSQSSLATQPPRYKYTPETCRDSYSEWRPSEAWGPKLLRSEDSRRPPGHKEVPVSPRQGQIWHPSNKTPWSPRILRTPSQMLNTFHLSG